ncbi:FlgO family outer membrane protein [Candidatus Accumulibacter sp. ACC003]|uniref:FlgO family outer membrane protein n=1 Tax=Candidatus Accumulibacter sp. ACC003 TaxID=2823334 RepID=UPI0025BF1042|nr:FlgO family outer membrane protein [Candidatus Accumulibacter sp. ACC003]
MIKPYLFAGAVTVGLVTGCATENNRVPEPTYETAAKSDFVASNYRVADALIEQFRSGADGGPLIVATVVNIDALDQSSTLGRLISEQISARFSQRGFSMIEMKFRSNVYMRKGEGELVLTREIAELARVNKAQAVILGSYGTSGSAVYVNMKIVQPGSNYVLAAYDYVLPANGEIRSMLSRANR